MTLEDTTSESDVEQSGDTSVPDSQTSSESGTEDAGGQAAPPSDGTEANNVPFNDPKSPYHARFKELHEQATGFKATLEQERQERERMRTEYEQRLAQIQAQVQPKPQTAKPYQQLLQRLETLGVDPDFAKLLKDQTEILEQFPNLKQDLQTLRAEKQQMAVQGRINGLYDQYKIPAARRMSYENALIAESQRNPKLTPNDLESVFKKIHDTFTQERQEMERELLKGYVKAKQADKAPASTTGGHSTGAPKASKAKELTPEQYRAYVKGEIVKQLKSGKASE